MPHPGPKSALSTAAKTIIQNLWVFRPENFKNDAITKFMLSNSLEEYLGRKVTTLEIESAKIFRKNMDTLEKTGRDYVPVDFKHAVLKDVFSEHMISSLKEFLTDIESKELPYDGGRFFPRGSAQWEGWSLTGSNAPIIIQICTVLREKVRSFLSISAPSDEKDDFLSTFDFLQGQYPSQITYHKYRAGENDGTVEHRDPYAVYLTAVITLEEVDGALITERRDLLEPIGSRDVQLLAPNLVHNVPRCRRIHDRKSMTLVF